MKVLVVDDDNDNLNLIKLLLTDRGFTVLTSGNGEEAYRIILDEKPDIAIIDGLIPGIHGFELCKKVKEESGPGKLPKIIIMSALYKGIKYKLDVIKTYHADNYLPKPIKKEDLISMIEALV